MRNFVSKRLPRNSYNMQQMTIVIIMIPIVFLSSQEKKVSIYRSLDCLSQDLSVHLSGKGLLQKKRNNISPGAPSGPCLSLSPFFRFAGDRGAGGGGEIRGNEWEKRNSIDRGGSKELPMCHWSKWNHRRAFSSATTMRTPIAQKGSENAGNSRRCFLFVFPSSEVIDEHLGLMSVKAYHVYLALTFFRNKLWILSMHNRR